jgi:4-carboxymuconolactone decarboxylase
LRNHERFEQGELMRRRVLGDAHVDRSTKAARPFSVPIQELVTEYCWGAVWTRPGLELKTRSMLNLVMLTALNRSHELGIHVRGAVNNGCSPEEISECLLQAAVYCGVPAALEAFRVADRVLEEMSGEAADRRDGAVSE